MTPINPVHSFDLQKKKKKTSYGLQGHSTSRGENNHLLLLDISIIFPCEKKEKRKKNEKKEDDISACAETFCASFTADAAVWQLRCGRGGREHYLLGILRRAR